MLSLQNFFISLFITLIIYFSYVQIFLLIATILFLIKINHEIYTYDKSFIKKAHEEIKESLKFSKN